MAETATLTAPILEIVEKLNTLEATANSLLLERSAEIKCTIAAILSGRHLCMIGPPGIAKSFLTRTMVSLIDDIGEGEYFEWQVTKFSTPEELFGPHSLRALENDQYIRNTSRKLPQAKLAFIDEVFKASSALLNTLLPVLNERLFYNNGDPMHLPLSSAITASNETPEEASELAALWDRIAFRLFTKPIQNQGNFDKMLRAAADRFSAKTKIVPVISWDEIMLAQQATSQVQIPDEVFDAVNTLRANLARENILPSDRRFVELLPIIQSQAIRDGRAIAKIEDIHLATHVLWNTQSQQPVVQRLVFQLANPLDQIAMDMMQDVEGLAKQLDDLLRTADNSQEHNRKAIEIHSKLSDAATELKKLRKQAKTEGRKSEIMEPLRERILGLTKTLLKDVFVIDDEATEE